MSRFGFNFGRDNKKNNRREHDDIVLRHEPASEYDDYETDEDEGNPYYAQQDPRDPRFTMRPYRTEDAHSHRHTRQRPHEFDNNSLGFRRPNINADRDERIDDYQQHPSLNAHGPQHSAGYEQRQNGGYNRHAQRDNLKGLGFWNNEESDARYDDSEANAGRPSPLKFIVAVTSLIFVCTVTWLAYRWINFPTSDTPPLIQAETDPYRVRPENPGGTDFPHQDKLIYGRLGPSTEQPVERLLPPPEQPVIMAPTYNQPQQQGQYPQQQPAAYYPQNPQQQVQGTQPMQQAQPHPPAYMPANQPGQAPSQQQEQAQRPQGYPAQQHQEATYPGQAYVQPQQNQQQAIQTVQAQPVPVQQNAPNFNGLPQNQQPYQQPMAQNPATLMEQPAPVIKPTATGTLDTVVNEPVEQFVPADTTNYYLQLGTLANEPKAKKEKERLQKRYANELAGMDLSIKSFIASDGHKKYRIVAGPTIVSRKAALEKCTKLGNACTPVRN